MKKAEVLVLGGISECSDLTAGLLEQGLRVLVSRATDVPQDEKPLPCVSFRHGPLDRQGLEKLVLSNDISLIIDCTHPFAARVSHNAHKAAQNLGLPFLVYDRPGLDPDTPGVDWADDHSRAAEMALAQHGVVFLSIGSGNVASYMQKAGKKGSLLVARVLPGLKFMKRCLDAGLKKDQVIQARGPFSVEQNILHMSGAGAAVLVTKDSGTAGGVPAKLEAAKRLGVRVIAVKRPPRPGDLVFRSIKELLFSIPGYFS